MKLELMRFCGYTWGSNPLSLEVTSQRNNTVSTLPYQGDKSDDLGVACRVIKGKGELCGKDCLEQYAMLRALQLRGKEGILSLPGLEPMTARFTKLTALADVTPDTVTYSFEFTEVSGTQQSVPLSQSHKVAEGETLFDIAYEYGKTVDELVALNPSVRRPDELSIGEEIKIC